MASLLHYDSRRLYSWWWSSHVSPKRSKWLQENLTEMDAKVKAMIKLIEEDADSFARRAEMYYKRRPELIKLVEQFYRAYRALAERYNHATAELRLAHRSMAEAFPDQVPETLADDSASSSSVGETDPHLSDVSRIARDLYYHDDPLTSSTNIDSGAYKKGLKLVQDKYEFEEVTSQNFGNMDEITSRSSTITEVDRCGQSLRVITGSEHASKGEIEVQNLKSILIEVQAEKGSILSKYRENMEKVADLERALDHAREDARGLDERAGKAENEIKVLKEALVKLESDQDACLAKYNQSLEMISSLEIKLSIAQEQEKSKSLKLRDELSRVEVEKEAGLLQYRQCSETIAALAKKISDLKLEVRHLCEHSVRVENEVAQLRLAVAKSNEEKEAVANLYKQCLETPARMEGELSCAQEDAQRLNNEVVEGAEKLKSTEEQCVILEKSNQNLQFEAENLAQKISIKDQELSQKQEELESLFCLMQDEHLRFVDVEASLKTLEKLYQQSQEEQETLTSEIRSGFQMVTDLETHKHGLEKEIRWIKEENQCLSAMNATFVISENNLKAEFSGLNEMKEKLEREFVVQATQSTTLEQEIHQLREETKGLSQWYQNLLLQIKSAGLNPRSVAAEVLDLRNEYSKLEEMNRRNRDGKEVLSKKFENVNLISEKNAILETSLSQLIGVLEESRENVTILQKSCRILQGEKSSIVSEKMVLVSQLQTITENMENLLKKNSSLENSLSAARTEIDGLKNSSRRLEELSDLFINEKSHLVAERSSLALQLDKVEKRLESLEKRFTDLEEKCVRLEKEKETTLSQVEELKAYLGSEKQEHVTYIQSSEACLAGLENQVCFLQDEIKLRKREFEEAIERAVIAQVEVFILQKFVEDLEENFSLLVECERRVEASKLSTKLISALESENLEQQIETKMLKDEVARLRTEIFQIFKALQVVSESGLKEERLLQMSSSYHDRVPSLHILKIIEHVECSLTKNKDEEARLLIENSILFDILGEIQLQSANLTFEKCCLEEQLRTMAERWRKLEKDEEGLVEKTEYFEVQLVKEGEQREALRNGLNGANEELANIQEVYQLLQEKIMNTLIEKEVLSKKLVIAEKKLHDSEEENCALIHEVSALGNLSLIYQIVGEEKIEQLKALSEGLLYIQSRDLDLKKNLNLFDEKLQSERAENLHLIDTIEALTNELDQVKDLNDQLNHQILVGNDFLRVKAKELTEVDQRLELSWFSTLELGRTVQELKKEHEESKMNKENVEKQMMDLLNERVKYDGEIEVLHQANKKLQLEAETLRKEVQEHRIREENLSLELQKKCDEFELCEDEVVSFYFDLQISAVREVLLESKVQELAEACVSLKDGDNMESREIEEMRKRVGRLESKIGVLKSKLSAYAPIIWSITDGMSSFKQTPNLKPKGTESDDQSGESEGDTEKLRECESMMVPKMSAAIEKAVMEEMRKLKVQKSEDVPAAVNDAIKEAEHSRVESASPDYYNFRKANKHGVTLRNPLLMKYVPLDQNSDSSPRGRNSRWNSKSTDQINGLESAKCYSPDPFPDDVWVQKPPPSVASDMISGGQLGDEWKTSLVFSSELGIEKELPVEKISSFREMDREMNRRKILEMLVTNVQKLTILRTSVDDLKKKAEKKKRSKKSQLVKYEMVKGQLHEVEDTVEHLLVINDHLMKNVDEAAEDTNVAAALPGQEVRELARKESEKVDRLQFQVQNINYVLLKMKDQKKPKPKSKAWRSRTGILLRDFIYHSGSRSGDRKKKKSCFCGCATPRIKGG